MDKLKDENLQNNQEEMKQRELKELDEAATLRYKGEEP